MRQGPPRDRENEPQPAWCFWQRLLVLGVLGVGVLVLVLVLVVW